MSSDLRDLTGDDGRYCTGYAFNCMTGRFVTPGSNQNIIETWLGTDDLLANVSLGPVYMGNTSLGMNASLPGNSTSQKLNQWFLDALYNSIPSEGFRGAGDVYNLAKITYTGEYLAGYPYVIPDPIWPDGDAYEPMWDLRVNNMGGDPALPLWVKEPILMYPSYPEVLHCPDDFTVQVETIGGLAIAGVRVCLMLKSTTGYEVYTRGFTDTSGEFATILDPSFSGTMFVTITKQGYLPDEGEVRLLIE